MMGATDKGIPFVESDDLIAGWPAADELQAEKIDDLLPPSGGSASHVLTKQSGADGDYVWLAPQGGSGPDGTTPGELISGDDPNLLELSSGDGKLRVGDKDAAGNEYVQGLGGTRHYVGSGRPDSAGLDIQDAPEGSTYTCTDSQGGNNFGARQWSKGPSEWVCADGRYDTGVLPMSGHPLLESGQDVRVVREPGTVTYWVRFGTTTDPGKAGAILVGNLPPELRSGIPQSPLALYAGRANIGTDGREALVVGADIKFYGDSWAAGRATSQYVGGTAAAVTAWPTSEWEPTVARSLEELQELLAEIEAEGETHELWPQYEALKQELEQLHNQTGTGDIQ